MVALGLISYKGMQPDRAIRSVEDQEPEIVELADTMEEAASQEELSERVIQILKRWTQRREDEQAIQMLAGIQDSAECIKEYCELRRSGTPIEQALVLVGHEFRLRQAEYQPALR